jgi:hypothetical protein
MITRASQRRFELFVIVTRDVKQRFERSVIIIIDRRQCFELFVILTRDVMRRGEDRGDINEQPTRRTGRGKAGYLDRRKEEETK